MIIDFIETEIFSLVLISFCLLLSAFFSSTETAVTSLGTMKAKLILESDEKKKNPLRLWLEHPGRVLTTILIFNNVVNILASSVMTQLTNRYFENGAVGIATGVITFLVLVFGEVIPKSFAKAHSEKLAVFFMYPVFFIYYLSYPAVLLLSGFADKVIRVFSNNDKVSPLITEEEIEFMVSEGEKAGVIKDIKKDIIEGAFDFDETRVREIMTPRTNLVAFRSQTPLKKAVQETIKTGHSRIPVYKENMDHMVGIVLAKDLLAALANSSNQVSEVKDLMREAFFAPESKSIMGVFKDLKRSKNHMAIIIDEYGGTAGIVTMEDILEEIVGEIQDEHDAEVAEILKVEDNIYQVSGSVNIEEFLEYFSLSKKDIHKDLHDQDVDTIAGWVTQLVGQMPSVGQKTQIASINLEVLEVKSRRIDLLRVELLKDKEKKIRDKKVD